MTVTMMNMEINSQNFVTFEDAVIYARFIIGELHLEITSERGSYTGDVTFTCGSSDIIVTVLK